MKQFLKSLIASLKSSARRSAGQPKRSTRLSIEALEDRLTPATHTWIGNNFSNPFWSNPQNWVGGAPGANEKNVALVFSPSAVNASINDFPGLNVQSIEFDWTGDVLVGAPINLMGNSTV